MPAELTPIAEALLQYGVLGIIFAYVLYSDWCARKERVKLEATRTAQDNKREEDCVKRIRELEDRNLKFMRSVSTSTNAILEDLTKELRRSGFKIRSPIHTVVEAYDDETKTITRE